MGSWKNFGCSISRNSSGQYTVTCSAYLEVTQWDRQTYVVTDPNHGEARAKASRTSSGNSSWTGTSGTSFGPIYFSSTYYCNTIQSDGQYVKNGSYTFSASLAAAEFTIIFDPGEGTTPTDSKEVTWGQNYGELPVPVRSGCLFLGWFTAAEGGTEIQASDTVAITANTTLYAHWKLQTIFHLIQNESEILAPLCYIKEGNDVTQAVGLYVKEGNSVYQCI